MKDNKMQATNMQSTNHKLTTALAYADLGWQVFPCWHIEGGACACGSDCKSPGKHPISALAPRGQDSATSDKDIITQWWTEYPNANIAIYLAGSGLCAIDIDPRNGGDYTIEELEAIHGELIADVVQLTGGGGEHRLFLRPDGSLPGKLGKGVDVKLNGYIIAEPSNHISGGDYVWEASSCPLDGAVAGPLPDWIRSFSTLDKSVDTGVSLHAGMTDEQYYDVSDALPFIDNDERDTWLTVGMALHATNDRRAYEMWCQWSASSPKYDQKDQYRVWRSFRHKGLASVDLPTIFKLAQDAGWLNVKKSVGLSLQVDDVFFNPSLTMAKKQTKVPEHLLTTPVPMLNAIGKWMEGFSREPQPQITVQGELGLASVLCGRMYCSTEANTSSLYLMTLGETGVGKNYVKTAIQRFLSETGFQSLLSGSGNTSSGAVFSALFDAPCHIQIMDEIGKHLQTARKQQNGQMAEGFATLVEAYSSTTGLIIPKNYSTMNLTKEQRAAKSKNIVHCPAITILGLATPGQVYDNLSTCEIEDGFLNRLIVVDISEPQRPKQRTCRLPVLDEFKAWAKAIRCPEPTSKTSLVGYDTDYDVPPSPIIVEFDDKALDLFDDYQEDLRDRESAGDFITPDLTRRWTENAMRLATCLAVCANPANPVITPELAQWSLDYVEFYGHEFMQSVATKVADSEFHRLYLAVMDFVSRAGERGMTEYDLSRHCRLFAATAPHQRDQVLSALDREGRIRQFSFKPKSGRGRPRVAWIGEEFITDELLALAV